MITGKVLKTLKGQNKIDKLAAQAIIFAFDEATNVRAVYSCFYLDFVLLIYHCHLSILLRFE